MSLRISSTDTQMLPYKGLRPYEEEDRENFFGRDADCRILIDKILANRVTLLFAASGVGKSSLLQAKVLPQLNDPQHENLDTVYYRDWVLSPLPTLKQHILATLKDRKRLAGDALIEETKEDSLEDFFALCAFVSRQPLVIALDQFEEFFHNQRYAPDFKPFIEQLSAAINNRTIPIAVIIAMREDFALELDAFRPFIPHLLENRYRLQRLTKNNAREAIAQPVQRLGFHYEPALLDKLLSDLVFSGQGDFFDTASFNPELMDMVDPVALQIVCSQLWDIEKTNPDRAFHLKTYEDKGGADAFFRSYIEDISKYFSPEQKYLAYQVSKHLLTRRGTKIAFTLNSLKRILPDADESLLQQLINDLQNKRILRYQWRKEERWYEIYHDRFYHAIEKWSESYNQERAKELSRFLEEFFSMAAQFSRKERGLTALALERLTADTSPQEGYSAHALAAELNEDGAELAGVLARLEAMHIVRKKPEDQGFVLYDNLFSGPLKQWNRNYHLRKKRIRRNFLMVMAVAATAIGLITWDIYVNLKRHYFYLSVKEGLAENVEIYRGKPKSLDVFNLQTYVAETDYRRLQFEPVMLFKEKAINNYQQLHTELIRYLRLVDGIEAYWRDGQTDTAFKSVKQGIKDYPERKQAIIDVLASFRSLETINILAEYLRDESKYRDLHEQIVTVMASLPTPRALEILLAQIKDLKRPAKVRRAAVEALERISHTDFGAAHADKIKAALISLHDQARREPLMGDEEALVRLAVARTLARLGSQEAVGELKELAKGGRNTQTRWEIRSDAVEALAGLRDADFVASLLKQVGNKSSAFTPWGIVGALGQMGGSDVVDKLLELLAHDSVNIRRMAVEALGRTGEPRVVQSLITRLDETKEDEPEVRQSIAEALGRLGNSAAIQRSPAALMEILRGEDNSPMSRMVMETLERTGTAEMCKTLLDNLEREGDTRKRRAIVHALGRLGDVRAIPPLSRAISSSRALQTDATDAKDDVRQSAAEALARLGESAAVDPLIEVLSKEKGRARLHVVSALGRLGHAKALKPLQDILQQGADRQDPVYLGALIALSQLGDISALDHLTIWLRLGDSLMRRGSLETLVGSSTARWIESRIFAQSGEEGYIRQAAVEALGRFDSLRPIDLLITRLSDGNIFVRRGAARALGRLGSRDIRVVEPLIARLNDGDSGVRQYAAEALGQLRDRRAVTPLIALLQDATSDVRRYAAEALGRLGDGRALQPLLSQLQGEKGKRQDGVEDVRRAALLAYAKIGLQSQQELAASKVRAVFNAAEHDRVKLVAAVALLALRPTDPPEAEIQAWLENYAGSVQTNRRKELADLLGEFPTAVGTRLLFRLLETENRREDRNLSVQVSALTALGLSQAQAALPELYTQLKNPNFRLQEAAAEALADIASAESIDPLTAITSTIGPAVSIPTRLAGLKALYNIAKNSKATDASWQKAIKGMLDAVQSRDGEAILGIRTYNLLGDLQAHGEPLDYLQKRLDQEAAQQSTWRSKRDAWEHKDATEEQTRPGQSELEKAQSRPHLAFELAYNIARIDPAGAGLRLLSHDLADIRRGAWLGLGTVGNVELLEKLHQARQHSHDPLFRHAAYQAIDHILLSLEAEEFKPQELLQQLEVLAPTLCKPVNASAEKGICLRVEWTMTQLRAKGAIHEQHSAEYSANQNQ